MHFAAPSLKNKKAHSEKVSYIFLEKYFFLYFRKWNFLSQSLNKISYIFPKSNSFHFKREIPKPEKQKEVHPEKSSYIFPKKSSPYISKWLLIKLYNKKNPSYSRMTAD